jgi:hypothetical protein
VFCGFGHHPACFCRLCRLVRRGYVIPDKSTRELPCIPGQGDLPVRPLPKPDSSANLSRLSPRFEDGEFEEKYPTLAAYLLTDRFEDGSPRQTATLMFFSDSGSLKACINDRHNTRSAFVTAVTWHELLNEMEAGLCGDTLDWRVKSQKTAGSGWTPF